MTAQSNDHHHPTIEPFEDEDGNRASLSPFVCACFVLNYLIGSGYLTLPWAFESAGLLLSSITVAFTCIIAIIASDYLLISMARADALVVMHNAQFLEFEDEAGENTTRTSSDESSESESTKGLQTKNNNGNIHKNEKATAFAVEFDYHEDDYVLKGPNDVEAMLAAKRVSQMHTNATDKSYLTLIHKHGRLLVSERKYELTQMCQIFLGKAGLLAYGICASLDMFGNLWAYAVVFGSAMPTMIPLAASYDDKTEYAIWLGIYTAVVVPLSMLHLSEQATVQVILSFCRILNVVLMVATPIAAEIDNGNPHFDGQMEAQGAPVIDVTGLHKMFPAVVFSLIFQEAIPSLADETKDKSKIGYIFGYTYVVAGLACCVVGIVGAWYFGDLINQSVNLNWDVYHAGTGVLTVQDGEPYWVGLSWWASIIRTFIVLFPAIDVVSSFPIYAYVLGNTLLGIFHADQAHVMQRDRKVLTFYRLVASVTPIAAALFVQELGKITDYAGLTSLAIAFWFPPMLFLSSETQLKEMGAPYKTRYERLGSGSRWVAIAMLCFAGISFILCFCFLTFGGE